MSEVYFLSGSTCVRYDIAADRAEPATHEVTAIWSGLDAVGMAGGWDAAVNYGNGKAYLFKDDGYVRVDIASRAVETELRSIGAFWNGMAGLAFDTALDAAVNYGDGTIYFFSGPSFCAYSIAEDAVSGGTGSIADWGFAADGSFDADLDAVVNYGNGRLYAFRGDVYTRFDTATAAADGGPSSIAELWPGMAEVGMTGGLRGSWCTADPAGVAAPAAERPPAVETPGGGRIADKRDPPASDLVGVAGASGGQVQLHRLAAEWWGRLVAEGRAAGIAAPLLLPVSGYRTKEQQAAIFARAVAKYGSEAEARKWVAVHSPHQSGRAVDCHLGPSNDSENVAAQRATPAWAWLSANAERFGFYPYEVEPWHWEYNPPA